MKKSVSKADLRDELQQETERFLQREGLQLVIRSHEQVQHGFAWPHGAGARRESMATVVVVVVVFVDALRPTRMH